MPDFREIFEAYGADYETTIGRFMGNEKMYLKFLNMLSKDENLHKLGDSIGRRDLAAAFEAAHTLKGVSANLGLTPLNKAVCAIVEPLRAGEPCGHYDALCQAIFTEYQRVEQLLERLNGGE